MSKRPSGYGWLQVGALPIKVGIASNADGLSRLLKKADLPDEPWDTSAAGRCITFTHASKMPVCVMYFNGLDEVSTLQVVGIVVHECAHVWQATLDSMGEEKPSSEFEAYTLQGFVQDTLSYLVTAGLVEL